MPEMRSGGLVTGRRSGPSVLPILAPALPFGTQSSSAVTPGELGRSELEEDESLPPTPPALATPTIFFFFSERNSLFLISQGFPGQRFPRSFQDHHQCRTDD